MPDKKKREISQEFIDEARAEVLAAEARLAAIESQVDVSASGIVIDLFKAIKELKEATVKLADAQENFI